MGTARGAPPVPVTVITHLGDCAGRRHDAPHLIVARIAVVPILKDENSSIIGVPVWVARRRGGTQEPVHGARSGRATPMSKRRAADAGCCSPSPGPDKGARPRTAECRAAPPAVNGFAECRAERPDVATIGGPSWVVNPTVGDEGRHGRPLHVEWASPRPMLEVKLGLGILEDESMDAPSSFE